MPWGRLFARTACVPRQFPGYPPVGDQGVQPATTLAADENLAVFGDFRHRSNSRGKAVNSPFSILMKVADGKVTYLQFLDDRHATAARFCKDGSWTVHTEPGAEVFQL
jgi:uncharacterized protein